MFASIIALTALASSVRAQIVVPFPPIYPLTDTGKVKYFSDPYHVPYQGSDEVYIAGTTHQYLECDGAIRPACATLHPNKYDSDRDMKQAANRSGTYICGAAGIHPFQTVNERGRSWDALVTLHVQDTEDCDGIKGWSVIVHAHPENSNEVDLPPTSWIGDKVLIGSFSENVDANYDGKYFKTPAGQLYLVYQKQYSDEPKRVGIVAWPMDNPTTKQPNSKPTLLLGPDDDLNSENYVKGNASFKLLETGNIRAINGKFLMAYSAGAFDHRTYKMGIAYSDTFLPTGNQQYRKVMKNNPDHFWNSQGAKEVYYLLQADEDQGWRYVASQVLAPGVPTVAQIGPGNSWVATFAGYNPSDAPTEGSKFNASHRRPLFVKLEVNVPKDLSVKQATDADLQSWITHERN